MAKIKIKFTKGHLEDSDNNGKLHLVGVEVVEFIGSSNPFGIKSKGIDTSLYFFSIFFMSSMSVAASKHIDWDRKKFIIDPSTKE